MRRFDRCDRFRKAIGCFNVSMFPMTFRSDLCSRSYGVQDVLFAFSEAINRCDHISECADFPILLSEEEPESSGNDRETRSAVGHREMWPETSRSLWSEIRGKIVGARTKGGRKKENYNIGFITKIE